MEMVKETLYGEGDKVCIRVLDDNIGGAIRVLPKGFSFLKMVELEKDKAYRVVDKGFVQHVDEDDVLGRMIAVDGEGDDKAGGEVIGGNVGRAVKGYFSSEGGGACE